MRSRLRDIHAGGLLKTGEDTMKKKIHPDNYREVVFQDFNADFSFLTRSAVKTTETIQWEDGKEYPLFKLDISSASHPFYTGKQTFVDTAGRVEKFKQRFDWEKGKAAEVIDQAEEQRTEKNRKQLEQEEATRKEAAERKSAREDRRRKILDSKKKKAKEQAEAKAAEEAAAAAEAPAAEAPATEAPAAEAPAAEAPAAEAAADETSAADDAAAKKPADTDS